MNCVAFVEWTHPIEKNEHDTTQTKHAVRILCDSLNYNFCNIFFIAAAAVAWHVCESVCQFNKLKQMKIIIGKICNGEKLISEVKNVANTCRYNVVVVVFHSRIYCFKFNQLIEFQYIHISTGQLKLTIDSLFFSMFWMISIRNQTHHFIKRNFGAPKVCRSLCLFWPANIYMEFIENKGQFHILILCIY